MMRHAVTLNVFKKQFYQFKKRRKKTKESFLKTEVTEIQ
jgi:hypothetical protein